MIFLHTISFLEYKENLFCRFLRFFDFGPFFGPIWVKFWLKSKKIRFFGPKCPQKWAKMGLTQKSKKQVLFVFQKASLSQKIRKFGKFGIEFYYLEGNFGLIFLTMEFPIHFAYFRRTSQL